MSYLSELGVDVASYPLRWRVWVEKFGMKVFQILKFAHQMVELLIANYRCIEHIIVIVMLVQLSSELLNSFFCFHSAKIINIDKQKCFFEIFTFLPRCFL